MKHFYLVDTENVHSVWVKFLPSIQAEDEMLLFYTSNSQGLSYSDLDTLRSGNYNFQMMRCFTGRNGLDFQLSSYLGFLISKNPDAKFSIIANDNGYDAMIRFWQAKDISVKRLTVDAIKKLSVVAPVATQDYVPETNSEDVSSCSIAEPTVNTSLEVTMNEETSIVENPSIAEEPSMIEETFIVEEAPVEIPSDNSSEDYFQTEVVENIIFSEVPTANDIFTPVTDSTISDSVPETEFKSATIEELIPTKTVCETPVETAVVETSPVTENISIIETADSDSFTPANEVISESEISSDEEEEKKPPIKNKSKAIQIAKEACSDCSFKLTAKDYTRIVEILAYECPDQDLRTINNRLIHSFTQKKGSEIYKKLKQAKAISEILHLF